jgi:hypothetical protein
MLGENVAQLSSEAGSAKMRLSKEGTGNHKPNNRSVKGKNVPLQQRLQLPNGWKGNGLSHARRGAAQQKILV